MPLGAVLNFWVEELGLVKPLTVEAVFPGGETNFGISEDEREETMLATPFGCCKMAPKGCEMLEKVSHGLRVGCPTIASSGMDSIRPLTILVMALTVAVIAAMFAPF